MHEKTLLYGALAATTLATAFGVYKSREPVNKSAITPVTLTDARPDEKTVRSAEVPIRLTSSDGTGLTLQALRASAVVEDPMALTELHLTFENPEDRILEGTFRITLPQGASLSRFAMKVNGAWQEGEVVEKQAARRAYEDFLHKRQDPALMEQGAGNEFTARVFPIPPRGTKEIIVAYSETLEAGAPYVLPLRGLPSLGSLDVDVHAAGARAGAAGGRADATFALHQQRVTPAADFVVAGAQLPRNTGLRNGDLVLARVIPFATSRPEPIASAVVLVDSSASRSLGLADQARLVQETLAKMGPEVVVTVACFDQEVVQVYEGKARGFGEREIAAIVARGALGASDVEQALAWAGQAAKKAKAKRILMVGDGVATAGETDAQKLRRNVESLREAGVERLDAVAVGGIRDDGFLRTVVRGVLDKDGVVLDGKLGSEAIARRLGEATSSGVPVQVEGARWSYPKTLDGLQAGDEVLVYAELDSNKPVRIRAGTQEFAPDLRTIDRPLVERGWAQAKIQSLVEAPTSDPASTAREIVALSTRHRVLSTHTAMLVLESDSDYARFGIDRNANLDILAVHDGRVAIVQGGRRRTETDNDRDERPTTAQGNKQRAKGGEGGEGVFAQPAASAAPPSGGAPGVVATATAMAEQAESAPSRRADDVAQNARPTDAPSADGFGRLGEVNGLSAAPEEAEKKADRGRVAPRPSPTVAAPSRAADPDPEAARAFEAPVPPPPPPVARPVAPLPSPRPLAATTPPRVEPTPSGPSTGAANGNVASGSVRTGAIDVERGISSGEVQRVVRAALPRLRACYETSLRTNPSEGGHVDVSFTIDKLGEVQSATASNAPSGIGACVTATAKSLRFPAPGAADARFRVGFDFVPGASAGNPVAVTPESTSPSALPYEGRFKIVMEHLVRGEKDAALDEAKRWQNDQPGDVMALVALGESYEARGDVKTAARAYGSILELFSFRADSRRFAGERLERLKDPAALKLAIDTYGKAAEQRPDHPASHRLYAFTLLKAGEHEKAFEAMRKGAARSYPAGRFRGVDRILKEDLGLIAAAWRRAEPAKAQAISTKLAQAGGTEETGPSLRFVLNWETDANDVDFHIRDGRGGHAFYSNPNLPSGGSLYADVTTGYGPECFTIRGAASQRAFPYNLQAHYYSRGPMGYGMGKLEIIDHDGKGNLSFEERPFVVMKDRAFVDLGTVDRPGKVALK